ncbi:Holliday junction DNA helicase RuvA [Catenibacillus scindens]|uniref:Holliday junction branch migration complex subunit RuvA n=1 Tax=Catenibacillus scindens TaxID=673271 RepID=A0A7W8HCA1_9FIRM|nr:Holliday junction branch migration protein RuvA [Catenibacillus scindens]MBB5265047.1 Holliday junction DNA helicase RuvA [Catenibacillus scindens]
MIAYIKGQIDQIRADSVILEHNGMGYEVFVPASVLSQMPPRGSEVKIYTYLYVREDNLCLYGFLNRDDLTIFRLLITVNGIGPKGALGILSTISPDALRFAILSEDVKTISSAPGIGRKTAQKLIIELKDKIHLEDSLEEAAAAPVDLEDGASESKNEALLAMVALGYSQTQALQALSRCQITPQMTSDAILKAALKQVLTL